MLRLRLFQWEEASFSLVWTFLHDALARRALLPGPSARSVRGLRRTQQKGENARALRAKWSYGRYIDWLLQRVYFAGAEAFWKRLLAGWSAPTPLVIDRQENVDDAVYQQGEAWEILDATVTARLRELARDNDLTVNSLVMGAWGDFGRIAIPGKRMLYSALHAPAVNRRFRTRMRP